MTAKGPCSIIAGLNWSDPAFFLLVFKILAQQDEITRLKKQEESQSKAELEKIKGGKQYMQVKFILNTSLIHFEETKHPFAQFWSEKKYRIIKLQPKSSLLCLVFSKRLRLWYCTRKSNQWKMRYHTSNKQMLRAWNHFQSFKRDWICRRGNCKILNFSSRKQMQRILTWVWKGSYFQMFCLMLFDSFKRKVTLQLWNLKQASKASEQNITSLSVCYFYYYCISAVSQHSISYRAG